MIGRRGFLGSVIGGLLAACGAKLSAKPMRRWIGGAPAAVQRANGRVVRWVGRSQIAAWSDPKNWSGGGTVPGPSDAVYLENYAGHIVMPRDKQSIDSLVITETFTGTIGLPTAPAGLHVASRMEIRGGPRQITG